MNPLNPRLERLLSLSRSTPPPPPTQRLETLVISAWRDRNSASEIGSAYPAALAFACGILVLTFVASYGMLAEPASPTVLLAHAALHQAIHP